MRKKVVAHVFFVVGGGLDVHKRARQFEKLHSRFLACFFCPCFLNEAKRKEGTAKIARGCRLSIALHPVYDGRQWTGLRPAPQPRGSRSRVGFGGQLKLTSSLRLYGSKRAPFAQASEADRKSTPGYSWPPHLYQEKSSLRQCGKK